MNAIVQTFKTLIGLFFDDGSLALAIVALLVSVALLAKGGLVASPLILILLLVVGALILLLENVVRASRSAADDRERPIVLKPGAPDGSC